MPSRHVVAIRDVTFTHENAPEPLFAGLSLHLPTGFTGVVGANGTGKTTFLQLLTGARSPTSGSVQGIHDALYCEQRTDLPPAGLAELLEDGTGDTFELRGRLGIEADFLARWDSLSHGERKRTQIAHALWRRPALLAIDEPTNHIDAQARGLLIGALERYRGVGVIVSHDRDLLDALCVQCLWLEPPNARLFPGGFTEASEQREIVRKTTLRERDKVVRERELLQREIVRRRDRAARAHIDRSKRGLDAGDSDGRERIDRARVSGKDGQAGRLLKQLAGRAARTEVRLEAARVEKQHETGIWLPNSRSRRALLFDLEPCDIALGSDRRLRLPRLSMKPDDRIALTGANGVGKSTLVRHLLHAIDVPAEHLIEMPQEVPAAAARRMLDDARRLPRERLGHVLTVVSRLGSRPQRLLDSAQPSPGEIRKLLLALGMTRAPHLIVLDEPTNHLDLPSIEALEDALDDCPCALLLVSHDQRFLRRLARVGWHIEPDAAGNASLVVH